MLAQDTASGSCQKANAGNAVGPSPWTGFGHARVLPEGGQVLERRQDSCNFGFASGWENNKSFPQQDQLVWLPPAGAPETMQQSILTNEQLLDWANGSKLDIPSPHVLDKLGDRWAAVYPDDVSPTVPQILTLAQPAPACNLRVELLPTWQVTSLALTKGDQVVVAGQRPGIAGQPAIVVELHAAQDWTTVWRTTLAAPYAQNVLTAERMPNGGTLLVTTRSSGSAQALALVWLDATGALQHEHVVAVAGGLGGVLTSGRENGAVALAVQTATTWRFAVLGPTTAWQCHATNQACPACNDGNPCTSDTCVSGRCHFASAIGSLHR